MAGVVDVKPRVRSLAADNYEKLLSIASMVLLVALIAAVARGQAD